ncbi:hypothetical protein ACHAXT_006811 [Thalassiosira profunda]
MSTSSNDSEFKSLSDTDEDSYSVYDDDDCPDGNWPYPMNGEVDPQLSDMEEG